MRTTLILVFAFGLAALFYFRGNLVRFSKDLLQPDLNPRLVNALQGDWALADDEKTVFRINRDSVLELHSDSLLRANSLSYVFREAAADYFTKDSSFVFSKQGKNPMRTQAFKLIEMNNTSKDTTGYTLVYVSKTRLEMISPGGLLNLNRKK